MQENIQRVLKRNSFTFSFLVLGLIYRSHCLLHYELDTRHWSLKRSSTKRFLITEKAPTLAFLLKPPVPRENCIRDPVLCLHTVGSKHGIMGRRFPDGLLKYRK